jgi:TolB-like protein/Tfp pilus assembly protein PilF
MAPVWAELKRRNVVKVALAYAIVAWLLIEISATLLPAFEAPDWILRVVVLLIGIGFVLAIILSWAFELTPQGVVRTDDVSESESVTHVTGRKLDFLIIAALVLALGFVVVDNYVLDESAEPEVADETAMPDPAPPAEESTGVLENSVAVLPFANLSADPDNAFFAAGIHEETLNQLVKIRHLSVISRTSVLRYENTELSIPEIASELNVQTILEGSVRYAGNRVRIAAQLIDAKTDEHLWSEIYDRDFSDIFAIQSDIAMNIANALHAEFSLAEQASLESIPTKSPVAYALYLRFLSNQPRNSSSDAEITAGYELLNRAIAIDPDFALAYVALARLNLVYPEIVDKGLEQSQARSRANVDKALELDPTLGVAYTVAARAYTFSWDADNARIAFDKAQELSPLDPDVLGQRAWFEAATGHPDNAIRLSERAMALGAAANFFGQVLLLTGQHDRATVFYENSTTENPTVGILRIELGRLTAARGDYEEAVMHLRKAEGLQRDQEDGDLILAYAYGLARQREDASRLLDKFEKSNVGRDVPAMLLALGYLGVGDNDRAYEQLKLSIDDTTGVQLFIEVTLMKVNAFSDPVLNEPRFVELRSKMGFQD